MIVKRVSKEKMNYYNNGFRTPTAATNIEPEKQARLFHWSPEDHNRDFSALHHPEQLEFYACRQSISQPN
jgi:hypothetical protein